MTVPASLDRRFRAAAAESGLLDVAYDLVDTPLGTLLVAASPRGLRRIAYDPDPELEADRLASRFGPRVLRYGYDLSYEDIGVALGSNADAARQAASSGIRRLRRKELQ